MDWSSYIMDKHVIDLLVRVIDEFYASFLPSMSYTSKIFGIIIWGLERLGNCELLLFYSTYDVLSGLSRSASFLNLHCIEKVHDSFCVS